MEATSDSPRIDPGRVALARVMERQCDEAPKGRKASVDGERELTPVQMHMIHQAELEGAPRRNRHGTLTLLVRVEALERRMDELCAA